MVGLLLLAGCASPPPPLTQDEVRGIHRIHISDDLGEQLQYVKIGTTVFNNKFTEFPSNGRFDLIVKNMAAELEAQGYEVVPSPEEADALLRVKKWPTYNHPSGYGPDGGGFFVHITLGMNPGVEAELGIETDLYFMNPKELRISEITTMDRQTGVKSNAHEWKDFTAEEREQLLRVLDGLITEFPEKHLRDLGLLPLETAEVIPQEGDA